MSGLIVHLPNDGELHTVSYTTTVENVTGGNLSTTQIFMNGKPAYVGRDGVLTHTKPVGIDLEPKFTTTRPLPPRVKHARGNQPYYRTEGRRGRW